mgnify:CR=1 FL=1
MCFLHSKVLTFVGETHFLLYRWYMWWNLFYNEDRFCNTSIIDTKNEQNWTLIK